MTKIIGIMGRKGGLTKSTVTVNLAAGLKRQGLKVLILETDGQGNSSDWVGLEKQDNFYDLIVQDGEFADLIRPVPQDFAGGDDGLLHILSAYDKTGGIEARESTVQRMYDRFQELRGYYDVVVGDTSPGATQVHVGWYYAADYIILPTTCEWASVQSIEKTMQFIRNADENGRDAGYPAARILGILPNRYSKGISNSQFNLGYLSAEYKAQHIYPHMRENSAWGVCERDHRSIYNPAASRVERRLSIQAGDARRELAVVINDVMALVEERVAI